MTVVTVWAVLLGLASIYLTTPDAEPDPAGDDYEGDTALDDPAGEPSDW